MAAFLVLLRLTLAAVFLVAAVTKLAAPSNFRRTLSGFGLPAPVLPSTALLIPLVELGIAAGLVVQRTRRIAAFSGLGLLVLFTLAVLFNLYRGRRPDCHCFGQLHSAPIGLGTILRNVVLAGVAGLLVWKAPLDPGLTALGLGGAATGKTVAIIAMALGAGLLAIQSWLLLQVLAQQGRMLRRLEGIERMLGVAEPWTAASSPSNGGTQGLPIGTTAPAFELADLSGRPVSLAFLRAAGKATLLFFVDPDCGACKTLFPEIARWQQDLEEALTVAVLSRGSVATNTARIAAHGVRNLLLQTDHEVADDYRVGATPALVLLGPSGDIVRPVARGLPAIQEAMEQLIAARLPVSGTAPRDHAESRPPGLTPGVPAPAFELSSLSGEIVSLEGYRRRELLLVFWNPRCGYCRRMLPELKAWERRPLDERPELLLISTGLAEENRAMELASPIVLDSTYSVGAAYAVRGTPSAVRIDADGLIASEVAAGSAAIFALASLVEQRGSRT